jgi:hypothetical protein
MAIGRARCRKREHEVPRRPPCDTRTGGSRTRAQRVKLPHGRVSRRIASVRSRDRTRAMRNLARGVLHRAGSSLRAARLQSSPATCHSSVPAHAMRQRGGPVPPSRTLARGTRLVQSFLATLASCCHTRATQKRKRPVPASQAPSSSSRAVLFADGVPSLFVHEGTKTQGGLPPVHAGQHDWWSGGRFGRRGSRESRAVLRRACRQKLGGLKLALDRNRA